MSIASQPAGLLRSLTTRIGRHPEHARIFAGLATVTAFVGVAKVVGALKEVAVAARYGVTPAMDAYVLLINLIAWPVSVGLSVATTALVPLLIQAEQRDPDEASLFRREALGATLAIGALASLAAIVALHFTSSFGTTASSAEALRQAPVLSLTLALGLVYAMLAAFLMAGRSYLNSLLDGAQALVIVAALLFVSSGHIAILIWATVIGSGAQVAMALAAQPGGARTLAPRLSWRSKLWPAAVKGSATVALGVIAMSATGVVDQVVASRLGPGSNATLGYAMRLTALLIGLGAIAVSRALLPAFSRMSHGPARLRMAVQWSGALFAAGCVVALIGWIGAPLGIRLLYQHGRFTPGDTATVARLFQFGLAQLPFYFAGLVMVQLLASASDFKAFALVGVGALTVKVCAIWWLVPRLGLEGVVLSTAAMYLATFLGMCGRLAFGRGRPA